MSVYFPSMDTMGQCTIVVPTCRRADVFYFICCPKATKEIRDLYADYARRFSKFVPSYPEI